MKPEIAKLWIEALRSGAYKQGFGYLRNEKNEFCCLGVLCNLHAQAHPKIAQQQVDPYRYLDCASVLPHEVKEWAGMQSPDGYVRGANSLVQQNDARQESFKSISDFIESHATSL